MGVVLVYDEPNSNMDELRNKAKLLASQIIVNGV